MPDLEAYEKSFSLYQDQLKEILHAAEADYYDLTTQRHAMQLGLFKNYIWIANILIAAGLVILTGNFDAKIPWLRSGSLCFYWFTIFSMLVAASAFFYGVDAMRGRKDTYRPFKRYDIASDYMRTSIKEGKADLEVYFAMLANFDDAIEHNKQIAADNAPKLRLLSRLLTLSAVFMLLAFLPIEEAIGFFIP